jgi:hypothetical protein
MAEPVHTVGGTVTDAGSPASGVQVELFRLDAATGMWGTVPFYDAEDDVSQPSVSTAPDGTWSGPADLTDGSYVVRLDTTGSSAVYSTDQFPGGITSKSGATTLFTVAGGVPSATSFPIQLVRNAGAVSVTLTDADTGSVLTSPAVARGTVNLSTGVGAGGNPLDVPPFSEGGTAFDGTLVVGGLRPGTYPGLSASATGFGVGYVDAPLVVSTGSTTDAGRVGLYPEGRASVLSLLASPQRVTVAGAARVGAVLTAMVPAGTTSTPVTATYQWRVDGLPVPGATAPTFVPTARDLGAKVSVRVTLRAPGYTPDRSTVGVAARVDLGDPNRATVRVAGAARFGRTVSASVGGSTVPDARSQYQWYRNGRPISGQDGSSYTIGRNDVGERIRVSVTSFAQGHTDAVLPSPEVLAKDRGKLRIRTDRTISRDERPRLVLRVPRGDSEVKVTGQARVKFGTNKVRTVTFHGSTEHLRLPKLSRGGHTIRVTFASQSYDVKSTRVRISVRR